MFDVQYLLYSAAGYLSGICFSKSGLSMLIIQSIFSSRHEIKIEKVPRDVRGE